MATIRLTFRVRPQNDGGYAFFVAHGETFSLDALIAHYPDEELPAEEFFPEDVAAVEAAVAALQPGEFLSIMHGT